MIKKIIFSSIWFLFVVGLLVACGGNESANVQSQEESEANKEVDTVGISTKLDLKNVNILISTGSESGSVYPIGVQIADFLQGLGATATNTTGNAIVNLELMEMNEAQIGHSSSFLGFAAENGLEPFEGRKLENVKAVAKLMDSTFQFTVLEKSGVSSLDEAAAQQYPLKLGVSQPGSEAELTTRRVLEAHGMTYEDIEGWGGRIEYGSHGDLSSLLRDGHIEAIAIVSSVPAAAISEIDLQNPMKVLPISEDIVNGLSKDFGYDVVEVAADAYRGQSEIVQSLGGGTIFFAHKDLPDEIVYALAKFISEDGRSNIGAIHHQLKDYLTGPEAAASSLGSSMHPGAEQYYKDAGVID